jgi:Tol biopolymer transport system component
MSIQADLRITIERRIFMWACARYFVLWSFAFFLLVAVNGCDDSVSTRDTSLPELIVYSSNPEGVSEQAEREIYVMNPDGSGVLRLTNGMHAFAPAWSPDGTMIAFGSLAELGGDGNIYVMNADGSDLRAVTAGPVRKAFPAWSPDGQKLAFTSLSDPDRLYTVALDGTDLTPVFECEFGCMHLSWSPDGSRIALVSWPPIEEGSVNRIPLIHLVNLDNPILTPLGEGFRYGHQPAWSPDGSSLVFLGQRDDPGIGIYTTTPTGEVLARLTNDNITRSSPGFSRDGSRIVYYRHDEPVGIYVMNADGSNSELIKEFPERHSFFPTPRWRP